jgi:hypothetical protein
MVAGLKIFKHVIITRRETCLLQPAKERLLS